MAALGVATLFPTATWAAPGVVLDGSFGASGALPLGANSTYTINASMGHQIGPNLFHSFLDFNLTNGQIANFTATGSTGPITNILARVTGGPSSIDGTIQSQIAGANLFLLNPAGVMFGPHAQVNVSGAFAVGTPDYVKLADGGKFNTALGDDSQLTSASVSAFGFLSATPASVAFAGSQLSTPTGFHVLAGNITLDQGSADGVNEQGTIVSAPSGNITLFSAASAGEVPFSLTSPGNGFASATNPSFGAITIQNKSKVAIDGAGGGKIVMRGGQLVVNNSTISSANSGSVTGGDISLQVDSLMLENVGTVASSTSGSGEGGAISVLAGSANIDGATVTSTTNDFYNNPTSTVASSGISTQTSGSGNGGAVNVAVAGTLNFTTGGQISSSTSAGGTGGVLNVQAATMTVDGAATVGNDAVVLANHYSPYYINFVLSSTISPSGVISETSASGNGGAINLTLPASGSLSFTNAGAVQSVTSGSGTGGAIAVQGGSTSIEGFVYDQNLNVQSSGLSSQTYGTGTGGAIKLAANALSLTNEAQISSCTQGSGAGGDISVTADTLTVRGTNFSRAPTGIFSTTLLTGNSGSVSVDVANQFDITSYGGVGTSSGSLLTIAQPAGYSYPLIYQPAGGQAGDISVETGSLSVNGAGSPINYSDLEATFGNPGSGIASASLGNQTTGKSGDVTVIDHGALSLSNGGAIAASTETSGKGGDVTVTAASADLQGYNGGVQVFQGPPSGILAETISSGNAGNLNVTITKDLTIAGFGGIDATTFGSGHAGNVLTRTGTLEVNGSGALFGISGISSSTLPSTTFSTTAPVQAGGNAGTVQVDATQSISLANGGLISAVTYDNGDAGDVKVSAPALTITGDPEAIAIALGDATGIFAGSLSLVGSGVMATGTGVAGNINVDVSGTLTITGYGAIDASTSADVTGGAITVHAGTFDIEGFSAPFTTTFATGNLATGVSSSSFVGSDGEAGSVNIKVDDALNIYGYGAGIAVITASSGNAGDITVQAGSINIMGEGTPDTITGIVADAFAGPTGNAGSISVSTAHALDLTNGAQISSSSESATGLGGSVTISSASDITLTGNSEISASSLNTNAGSITMAAAGTLSLEGESSINTSAGMDGGNITLKVGNLVYLLDSHITSEADGGAVTSGGNILIDPEFVVLDNSFVTANDSEGTGGNIMVLSNFMFNPDNTMTATGATDGTVTTPPPDLNLAASLLVLPGSTVDAQKELRERCARSLNHEFSSLIVVGRGGVESPPDELQMDFGN